MSLSRRQIYAKGDTLVFNVAKYANAKDNAIIDVIKRLPGVKVDEDGTIKYQGKPINKFYIDGNDFIGGQYGLATQCIAEAVYQAATDCKIGYFRVGSI